MYDATFGRALSAEEKFYGIVLYPEDSLGTIKSKVIVKFLLPDEREIMEAKTSAATFKNVTTVIDLVFLFYF